MRIKIICGKKGRGKTTYIKEKYKNGKYLCSENYNDSSSIDSSIFINNSTIILDSAELCGLSLFNRIINSCKLNDVNEVLMCVDVPKDSLLGVQNILALSNIDKAVKDIEIEEFTPEITELEKYLESSYPELQPNCYGDILSVTEYNYLEIDALVLRIKLSDKNNKEITATALASYLKGIISETFNDFSEEIYKLIEKSSIIGDIFSTIPLKSADGFGIGLAEDYIQKVTKLRFLIRACENAEHQYVFPLKKVYDAIFNTIDIEEKHSAAQILVSYYKSNYRSELSESQKIKILTKLLRAYKIYDSTSMSISKIRLELIYLYSITKDWEKVYFVAKEALDDSESQPLNDTMVSYVQEICIRALSELGNSKQAVIILDNINTDCSRQLLYKYQKALYLYNSGDIDNSFEIEQELVNYIKPVSNKKTDMDRTICNIYSLMATLQNHLSLADKGAHYYRLALNRGKMNEDTLYEYYKCLKKCGMFFQHNEEIEYLEEAIKYFEHINSRTDAGEAYMNLATEMLFYGGYDNGLIKTNFEKAISYFGSNSLKLSYVYNNMGIFYALAEDNMIYALETFKKAKLMGLSAFSYLTINLNICMCDLALDVSPDILCKDKDSFIQAYKNVSSRQNATAYEAQYKDILKTIILEHQGKNITSICNKHLSIEDDFFSPIWRDIMSRQDSASKQDTNYVDNPFFYKQINQKKIYFAEFRYWE